MEQIFENLLKEDSLEKLMSEERQKNWFSEIQEVDEPRSTVNSKMSMNMQKIVWSKVD